MKIERLIEVFCKIINKETKIKVKVQLAERMCGYDIVRLTKCLYNKECAVGQCKFINSEEEKAIDQLILNYYKQLDIREKIREKMKDSNF